MIDIIIPVYYTYDLLYKQFETYKNIVGDFKLLICDNTPEHDKKEIVYNDDMKDKIQVYHYTTHGSDGEKHGMVLDYMVKQCTSDIICIQDCDFFWLDKNILSYITELFNIGYMCVGTELHYTCDWSTFIRNNPDRKGHFAPCIFGMFINRELALSETYVSTSDEGRLSTKETGWRLREKIIQKNIKHHTFPAIQHPNQIHHNITKPWLYVGNHSYIGVHLVGSTSYNKGCCVQLDMIKSWI